jgi:hypothetical protein
MRRLFNAILRINFNTNKILFDPRIQFSMFDIVKSESKRCFIIGMYLFFAERFLKLYIIISCNSA